MHNYTTGFFVAHNTGVKHGDGHGDNGAMWRNAIFRNNLFLGTRYAFEFTTVADEGFRDFDYGTAGARPEPIGAAIGAVLQVGQRALRPHRRSSRRGRGPRTSP